MCHRPDSQREKKGISIVIRDGNGNFVYPEYWADETIERPRILVKPKPSKDDVFYKKWAAQHKSCMVCGISEVDAMCHRWPGLDCHHIVKPGRAHEATNLIRVCRRCHQLAEGSAIPGNINGVKYLWPKLTIENVIWCKMLEDHESVDLLRLSELLGRYVPKPVEFDHLVRVEMMNRKKNRSLGFAFNLIDSKHDGMIRKFETMGIDMDQFKD
jgi:hypothetical protein